MKNLIPIFLLLFIGCDEPDFCTPTDQECTVTIITSAHRCPDPVTGEMTDWEFEKSEETYIVKSECSLQSLIESVENNNQFVEGFNTHSIICRDRY